MKVTVILIGKVKNTSCRALVQEYVKRFSCQFLEMRPGKELSQKILSCRGKGMLIALSIQGKHFSSEQFAAFIKRQEKPLIFVIGDEHGLPEDVLCKADMHLSLSEMTFPHELATVLLLEQLYRTHTIMEGHPYHK